MPVIHYVWLGLALFAVSMMMCGLVYPLILRMARVWGFYDNPGERKLQRNPVPVLGGLAVFFGIVMSVLVLLTIMFHIKLVMMFLAMAVLLALGMIDDRMGLKPLLRFVIEIAIVGVLVWANDSMVDNLHGLWGIYEIPYWLGFALSVFAGVGIINSINLIDGVDGYSSGFITICCILFSIVFYYAHIHGLAMLSLVIAGALIPFFIHNVFGKKSKMFIGDGGTLMLGVILCVFVFSLLKTKSYCVIMERETGLNLVALSVAILSIPVADTLRVMTWRILKGISPFKADKTHLHHLFIDLGFSHLGTTLAIMIIYALVLASLAITWLAGGSGELQLYVVVGVGFLLTTVFYALTRKSMESDGKFATALRKISAGTHWEGSPFWNFMRKFADGELFIDGKEDTL